MSDENRTWICCALPAFFQYFLLNIVLHSGQLSLRCLPSREMKVMAATRQKERSETRRLTRPRRVTVDLTPPAVEELELVKEVTRLKTADVFRYAFTLLRIYVAARSEGKDLIIVDPKDPREKTRLELPISIRKQPAQLDRESS